MQTAISITALSKSFGEQGVLKEINLSVGQGEYIGLVGVNGAGKTTLIKCLLDFCTINGGGIAIFGVNHRETRARQRLTYLPERFLPPYYLTGQDFLCYMAELHGVKYDTGAVVTMLEIIDLDPSVLNKPVREYSKGMGQKLGLAACLLSGRDLMIFDEPMSGLDPKARALVKRQLLILKGQGKTLFYSTHLLEDIADICDRVVILHEGRICFVGTVAECCNTYQADDLEAAYLACVSK
jgi:ABC-2 type transport system ATP-binding protein